jgi:hypothetical protein
MARRLARTTGRLAARSGDRGLRCRPAGRPAAAGQRGKGLGTAATRPRLATGTRRPRLATRTRRPRLATRTRRPRLATRTRRPRLATRTRKRGPAVGPVAGLTGNGTEAITRPEPPGLAASPGRAGEATALRIGREGRVAVGPRRAWLAWLRQDRFGAGTGRVLARWHRPAAADPGQPEPPAPSPAVGAEGRCRRVPGRLPAPITVQGLGCILAAV